MDLDTYMNTLKEYDNKIKDIELSKQSFIAEHLPVMQEEWRLRLVEGRKTFLKLIPFIIKHKDHFLKIDSNYVVDCFHIITKVGKPLGCGYMLHDGITIKNLLKLWDKGFTYNDCPIVEYLYFDGTASITYIKDNEYVKVKTKPLDKDLIDEVTKLSYTIKKFSNDYKRFVEIKKEV